MELSKRNQKAKAESFVVKISCGFLLTACFYPHCLLADNTKPADPVKPIQSAKNQQKVMPVTQPKQAVVPNALPLAMPVAYQFGMPAAMQATIQVAKQAVLPATSQSAKPAGYLFGVPIVVPPNAPAATQPPGAGHPSATATTPVVTQSIGQANDAVQALMPIIKSYIGEKVVAPKPDAATNAPTPTVIPAQLATKPANNSELTANTIQSDDSSSALWTIFAGTIALLFAIFWFRVRKYRRVADNKTNIFKPQTASLQTDDDDDDDDDDDEEEIYLKDKGVLAVSSTAAVTTMQKKKTIEQVEEIS